MRQRVVLALGGGVAALGVGLWALVAPGASGQPAASTAQLGTPSASPSAAASDSPRAASDGVPAGMRLVFNQAFTGSTLDTSTWATCYPWLDVATGCTNFDNGEDEWYLPSQVKVANNALHLVARQESTEGTTKEGSAEQYACRSGMVTTFPGFRFKYGLVKVVARIPAGAGLWSGIWLAAANEKWPPEIDLLERWGSPISVAGVYLHPTGTKKKHRALDRTHLTPTLTASLASGWHTFSVLWTSGHLTWDVDGHQIMSVSNHIPHQLMYLIADLANKQIAPGTCEGQLLIRSVQVWQQPAR